MYNIHLKLKSLCRVLNLKLFKKIPPWHKSWGIVKLLFNRQTQDDDEWGARLHEMKWNQNQNLELQLLLAVTGVPRTQTPPSAPSRGAGLQARPEHVVLSMKGNRVHSRGGNSPAAHQSHSRIRSELDTERRQVTTKGENSFKSSGFLLKCFFPRHCEQDGCQRFSRTKHTDWE